MTTQICMGRSLSALSPALGGLWAVLCAGWLSGPVLGASPETSALAREAGSKVARMLDSYCLECHDHELQKGGLDLSRLSAEAVEQHSDDWERVVRKLQTRQMPPLGEDRPETAAYDEAVGRLVAILDRVAARRPDPGRTETVRRLNRTEYGNAVRDLLDLEVDMEALLPKDDAGHGFDNVTVGDLSPTLLDRYIVAAQRISRMAVGAPGGAPGAETFRVRADLTQEEHVAGLPLGTRGGLLIPYNFPRDGEYDIHIRLARDRNEEVEGLREAHELEVLLDRERMKLFTVTPPSQAGDHATVDAGLQVRIPVRAGPHELGVTFLKYPTALAETRRQPYEAHFNMHRHPRRSPAIYQVSIYGPYGATGAGDTPSRRRIFLCRPDQPEEEASCAKQILSALLRRAYRRPVLEVDLARPMEFFREGRAEGGFERGIEAALSAVLVSPEFLIRIEPDPPGLAARSVYRVSDLVLASRLSFFLWSSIPDEELLATAERGVLHRPRVLERQVRRMLADGRAGNLVRNFAQQWLYLRNLEVLTPDLRLFPDFDDNLRRAFREETERLVESVVREDRSVLELLQARETFLNERLARHYGIPHVYGSRFRRVAMEEGVMRGGLLRQGSILTLTSYATRTSPVVRGNWVLGNLLGAPAPPPPANVPALSESTVAATLPMRERLAAHRANPACAGCHNLMDPVGFALENYDAIGRWRTMEEGRPVDAAGGLPDGGEFVGVAGLEEALRRRPEMFVTALTEKLLTFALGRGVGPGDAAAVRRIVREAQAEEYAFSSIILGIAKSVPLTMRTTL